jgi:hypothetical protein
MDELKNPEERNDTEKSARWLFSEELVCAFQLVKHLSKSSNSDAVPS